MYNILARIADHNKYTDKYNYEETGKKLFAGPWEPFVRDFDPTLNKHFMNDDQAPIFESIGQYVDKAKRENIEVDISSTERRKKWLKNCLKKLKMSHKIKKDYSQMKKITNFSNFFDILVWILIGAIRFIYK